MARVVKPPVPLQLRLRFRVGILISGATLMAGLGFYVFGLVPMIERVAESQFSIAATKIEASLDMVFEPTEQVLAMSHGWLANSVLDTQTPVAFNRLYRPVLQSLPQATSIVAGTSAGEGWMLLQQPDGTWLNRLTDLKRRGQEHLFFERRADGSDRKYSKSMDYDPRKRAWYTAAMDDTSRVQWTEPYTFMTTGEPGITASKHVALKDGRDLVIGLDLKLRDLSFMTMNAHVGPHGMVLVLTDDMRVLALPTPVAGVENQPWLKRVLKSPSELEIAPLTDALAHWPASGNVETISYRSLGADWLARRHAYPLGKHRLWIVTLAPAADFMPHWRAVAGYLISGLALMLVLAALFARQQARRIARPLEMLAAESERIGQLDFHVSQAEPSDISEIVQLANAQEKMRALLQINQQQIASKEEELHAQIEALREAEIKIRESEAYNKVLFSDSSIPLVVVDPETGCCVDCNQAAARIYKLSGREAVLGLTPLDVSAPTQYDGTPSAEAARARAKNAIEHGAEVFEWKHRRDDGTEWDAELHLTPFQHGGRLLLQLSLQDITERKRSAIALENLALFDTLTGLPNRAQFLSRLRQSILSASRNKSPLSVLFLDLDRFKEINDTQGHAVGDDVLCEVAQIFRTVLRGEEMLARIGGDEFAIVAANTERTNATFIAERLLGALRYPLKIEHHQFSLGVSIGIALYNHDGTSPDTLLRNADIAMYRAKMSGRGYVFYEAEMSSDLAQRITLVRELKKALSVPQGELALYFQPQFDLRTGALLGAEALLRWDHPSLGPISPVEFISLAEERGMMALIGSWVLEEACRQSKAWLDSGVVFTGRLAINISARQIEDADFPAKAVATVRAYGLCPEQFEFELTESGMMRNVELAIELFEQLNISGFTLAIDDFGTGYSSLAYLKRLPARKLKIDMAFVRDMIENASDHAIVNTIIGMGRTLGLRTIAEGVETQAQADALLAMGCDEVQGFFFGCPEPAAVFEQQWLRVPNSSAIQGPAK